ncbi:MAG: ASKHA domain-containing protein [Firmicutes bacterium]|nr:ASKHA domain-containing protein [Bacillota bacterium]
MERFRKHKVVFLPANQEIMLEEGESLLTAARELGISLASDCNGAGICAKCKLRLVEGKIHSKETFILSEEETNQGVILACASYPMSNLVVEVPEDPMLAHIAGSGDRYRHLQEVKIPWEHEPLVEKLYLEMDSPDEADGISDLDRLLLHLRRKTGIVNFDIPFDLLRKLPGILRASNWKVTVTFGRAFSPPRIFNIETGNRESNNYGVAIDIGTTNIEGIVINMKTGKILHYTSYQNPQTKYGEDITARLNFAADKKGLLILSDILVDRINEILMELIFESRIERDEVNSVVISGNTVMMHFLLGLETDNIRKDPCIPVALKFPSLRASDLYLYTNPEALVYFAPCCGSFVGGDLIFALVASGMPEKDFVLADLGTNGEVAAVIDGTIMCAATSAGPAFEGGGMKCGSRAVKGAIYRVVFDEEKNGFEPLTIGNKAPIGICGTGMIDLLAHFLARGITDRKGHFTETDKNPLIRVQDGVPEYVLIDSGYASDIVVTEKDIEYFIHTKAAVFTGIDFLMKQSGKKLEDIDQFIISGALGIRIDIENSIAIGLFPGIDREKFISIGNGSLQGGRFALMSGTARRIAHDIASAAAYFELTREPDFMNDYTSALFLPHTDISRFGMNLSR